MSFTLEPCADVIVSAAVRRSISVGGGAPRVPKICSEDGAARATKNIFSKIPGKNFVLSLKFSDDLFKSSKIFATKQVTHGANCAMAWGPRRRGPRDQLLDFFALEN